MSGAFAKTRREKEIRKPPTGNWKPATANRKLFSQAVLNRLYDCPAYLGWCCEPVIML